MSGMPADQGIYAIDDYSGSAKQVTQIIILPGCKKVA